MKKISDKAKRYIQDYTRRCSNELVSVEDKTGKQTISHMEWLTVEDAESACLIEREEVLRDVTIWIKTNLSQFDITDANGYTIDINDIVYFINQKLNTKKED